MVHYWLCWFGFHKKEYSSDIRVIYEFCARPECKYTKTLTYNAKTRTIIYL